MALATALGKSGFIAWVAQQAGAIVQGAGFSWMTAFSMLFLFYTYANYCFATVTARISAMFVAFIALRPLVEHLL